uniref:Deubiquitinating enzyme MINDY-3/4 conserved domain-containing protein n=1 Tax=Guillardia theta (strain CCMP2712) TaxID=905079 RepID=A0A0C3TJK1_GUITC
MGDDTQGLACFLYSAILSRGPSNVHKDMESFDANVKLMGQHNYCSQEMVNLLLVGKAVPHVFDGTKELDGLTLNGISCSTEIGFFSLFEHYRSIEVGSLLKNPKYPVWVVCSESHFSVFFSANLDALEVIVYDTITASLLSIWQNSEGSKEIDLYYYDELAKQDETIRLSVSWKNSNSHCGKGPMDPSIDLTPPLEHCIRTKWPQAVVDWNGSDPVRGHLDLRKMLIFISDSLISKASAHVIRHRTLLGS